MSVLELFHASMLRVLASLRDAHRQPARGRPSGTKVCAMPKSTFGPQSYSQRSTLPAYGFGDSTREDARKVFVSSEHTLLATYGRNSPGPATYLLPASVGGRQPDARKHDPPSWAFSKAQRFKILGPDPGDDPAPNKYPLPPSLGIKQPLSRCQSEPLIGFGKAAREDVRKVFISKHVAKIERHGLGSPGPAAYAFEPMMGKRQHLSRMDSAASFTFASKMRPPDSIDAEGPGPAYTLPPAIGPQIETKRSREKAVKFSRSSREDQAKVFISREHGKMGRYGLASPGPAVGYKLGNVTFGKQVTTKYETRPRSAFATASRWGQYEAQLRKNNTPGPGSYDW